MYLCERNVIALSISAVLLTIQSVSIYCTSLVTIQVLLWARLMVFNFFIWYIFTPAGREKKKRFWAGTPRTPAMGLRPPAPLLSRSTRFCAIFKKQTPCGGQEKRKKARDTPVPRPWDCVPGTPCSIVTYLILKDVPS